MFCRQCGKEISEDNEFCGHCGKTMHAAAAEAGQPPPPPGPPAAAPPPQSMGAAPVVPPAGPPAGPPTQPGPYAPPPKKSVLPWVLGGIGLVAIVAVVLVLVFVVFGGGESADISGAEQVVENYFKAMENKDAEIFVATLEPSFRSELEDTLGEYYDMYFEFFFEAVPEDLEVTIRKMETEINGDEAVVTVVDGTMTHTDEYGDEVTEEASESDLAFVYLERVDGKWYMSSDALKEAGLDLSEIKSLIELESLYDSSEPVEPLTVEVIPPIDSVEEAFSALLEVPEISEWYYESFYSQYTVTEESTRYVFYLYEQPYGGTETPFGWYEVDKETGEVFEDHE